MLLQKSGVNWRDKDKNPDSKQQVDFICSVLLEAIRDDLIAIMQYAHVREPKCHYAGQVVFEKHCLVPKMCACAMEKISL